jgi:hypothetical protein
MFIYLTEPLKEAYSTMVEKHCCMVYLALFHWTIKKAIKLEDNLGFAIAIHAQNKIIKQTNFKLFYCRRSTRARDCLHKNHAFSKL